MKKNVLILALLTGISMIFTSCYKDWQQFVNEDVNKITVDSINLQPGAAIHVGSATFKISDLVKEKPDTLEFVGSDSLMTFRLQIDTLYNMAVADVYTMPTMDPISGMKFDMGDMTMSPISASKDIKLKQLIDNINPAFYPGTGNVFFPPISNVPAGDYAYNSFGNFKKVTFKSGQFTVTMVNNTPLTVTVVLGLRNSDSTYFGNDITFSSVPPNSTVSQTVDAANQRMTNQVTAQLKSFTTTGGNVVLNGNESFSFNVSTSKPLVIQSAIAKIPYTEFMSDTVVDITPADNPTMDIKTLKLTSGSINFKLNGSFPAPIQLDITMPYTKDASGNPLSQTLLLSGSGTGKLDLSGTTTDLTQGGTTKNSFSIKYKAFTSDTSNFYTFTPPANFSLDASFDNFNFDYVEGSLGNMDSIQIPSDTMQTGIGDVLDKISGSIKITNPTISVIVANSFGFGIHLNLNVTGKNGTDSVVMPVVKDLNGATNPGDNVLDSLILNKDNSNIVDFIALPPQDITFGGVVKLSSSNLFITAASKILAGLHINVPFEINLNNVAYIDTMNLDSTSIPKEIKEAALILQSTNGFPLSVGLSVELYDSIAKQTIETIEVKNTDGNPLVFAAAKVEADGSLTPSTNKIVLSLGKTDFDNLQKANKLILHLFLNTDDATSGKGVPFNANSKLTVDVAVAAQADLTVGK